jgi:HAD superfamily hydrolase (TIGR01490 family)
MPTSQIAAIFDLDGTLYTGHIAKAYGVHHRTKRVKRLQLGLFMATHIPLWWLVRAGVINELTMRRLWAQDMGWMVRGWTPQEARVAFTWIAENYVRPLVKHDVLQRAHQHRDEGHRTILVSGTSTPLLEMIGLELGIEEVVGTPLLIHRGRYSGGSERPVCQGPGKVSRLEYHLGSVGAIDWEQSFAYADSILDLPMLEKVGNPVAVYPDQPLRDHAVALGWEIFEQR